jgi:hypothetical protein
VIVELSWHWTISDNFNPHHRIQQTKTRHVSSFSSGKPPEFVLSKLQLEHQ